MCEELKLIQPYLGVWKLENWNIPTASVQLSGRMGIYCIQNLQNKRLLIGEGKLGGTGSRPKYHLLGRTMNTQFDADILAYGKNNFRLIWIIEENCEINRKVIENKIQKHFGEICYNRPRNLYPTQQELLSNIASARHVIQGDIITRINRYKKTISGCWESDFKGDSYGYGVISYKGKSYKHHVLMYILHYGDICGISSVIHHKCENKKCVNPEHLELVTHTVNICLSQQKRTPLNKEYTSQYHGVHFSKTNGYVASVAIEGTKTIGLGYYHEDIHAAQNRDWFVCKFGLLAKKQGTLNFHNIDYTKFKVWPMKSGKLNKVLSP